MDAPFRPTPDEPSAVPVNALVGTFRWDLAGGEGAVDPAWCASMGINPCTGAGHLARWEQEIHPDDVAEFRRRRAEIESGRVARFEAEYRVFTASARWIWLLQRGQALRDAGIAGICIDIDERKRAELTLQQSESQLATALWGAQAALWHWHIPTNAVTMSPLWFAMTGYTREQWEAVPNPWMSHIHPDDRRLLDRAFADHLARRAPSIEGSYRIRTAAGEWKWMLLRGRAIEWDLEGRPTIAVGVSLDIDAQKRAELEFARQREGFEIALAGARAGMYDYDVLTRRVVHTAYHHRILGLEPSRNDGNADRFLERVHPEDRARADVVAEEARAGITDTFEIQYRVRHADGSWRWVMDRARVVERGPDRRATRVVGVIIDITDRVRTLEELQRSEMRYRTIASLAPGFLFEIRFADDPDDPYCADSVWISEGVRDVLGCTAEEVVRRGGAVRFVDPDCMPLVREHRAAVRRGERRNHELRVRTACGEWKWVFTQMAPVRDSVTGAVTGAIASVHDITQRKAAEQALRQSEAALRESVDLLRRQAKLLETMREGVVLLDYDGYIRFTNPALDQMFGYGPTELVGRHMQPLFAISEPQREIVMRELQAQEDTGVTRPVEAECVRRDGTRFVASFVTTSLELGGAVHWLAVASDVTERVRLERIIIEIASRERQRIGSDLHDGLGQELTGIALMLRGMAAQMRDQRVPAQSEIEEIIGLVNGAIESTRALARGLSPVSAVRGGLVGALGALATRVGDRGPLRVEVIAPPESEIRLDESSATHLYRIAQEALTNVMRHAAARRARIELRVLPGENLQLSVTDDGRGLPAAAETGGGLGLGIMRYRARMLGGDLVVGAGPEGGCVVRFVCPNGPRIDPAD